MATERPGVAGQGWVSSGAGKAPRWSHRRHLDMTHHTESVTIDRKTSGSLHTNLGATGAVTLTLPQDALAGDHFEFVVMAAQQLRVDPGAAGALYIGAAKQADDAYAWADAINESLKMVCDGNNDWVAMYLTGTWTVV